MKPINDRIKEYITTQQEEFEKLCSACTMNPANNPQELWICQELENGKKYEACHQFQSFTVESFNRDIPAVYYDSDLSNFRGLDNIKNEHGKPIDIFKVIHDKQNLYISGLNGTGKTHISYGILKEIKFKNYIENQHDKYKYPLLKIFIISERDCFRRLQNQFELSEQFLIDIKNADLVVWSEFGKKKPSEFISDIVASAIDIIWESTKSGLTKPALIINTTLNVNDILERYADGGDIYSRFTDLFKGRFIYFKTISGRG